MLDIFIGYDPKETVAYHVLSHSLIRQAGEPIRIAPLHRYQLRHVHTRDRGPMESTEFSITRFLVPHLSGFRGWSLFMDCDMLAVEDITRLFAVVRQRDANDPRSVYVCQHNYTPTSTTKFLNQPQTAYPRKNWSSVMLFNNARCHALTAEYVNAASGLDLHRFTWLPDDQIGSLPLEWNWLVGEYVPNPEAKVLHWTLGGPWFAATATVDHADRWQRERDLMLASG
jgi:hypothetical protein